MQPTSRAETFATPADRAACRQSIRQGSRSFHLAGRLLPAEVREPAFAIYAFCRMADDRIDREEGGMAAIAGLTGCLDRVYGGRPGADFVERAFADAVRDFAIPKAVPEALIEGLRWDAEGRSYATLGHLAAYAVRVAGSVGVMMSLVMRRREPAMLARACDLGIAMQFTNICRDVGEDARIDRVYLPEALLAAAGTDARAVLAARSATPEIRLAIRMLLDEAERLYDRAACGVAELPAGSRLGINAARLLYREIGRRVRDGIDPVAERARVGGGERLALLVAAANLPHPDSTLLTAPCAPEASFLMEAVARTPARRHRALPRWWDVGGRAVRMLELLSAFDTSARAPGGGRAAQPRRR